MKICRYVFNDSKSAGLKPDGNDWPQGLQGIQDECMIIYLVMVESWASLHTLLWEEEFNMNNKNEDDIQRTSFGMQLEMEE